MLIELAGGTATIVWTSAQRCCWEDPSNLIAAPSGLAGQLIVTQHGRRDALDVPKMYELRGSFAEAATLSGFPPL